MKSMRVLPVSAALAHSVAAQVITYDAAMGTLPQAQGFTLHESGSSAPAPHVSGGLLHQGPTSSSGSQWWDRTDVDIDFARGASMSARLRVTTSSFSPGMFPRTGFYLTLGDNEGRFFYVGIAQTVVLLANNHDQTAGPNSVIVTADTTSAMRAYDLSVSTGMARLRIDGQEVAAVPVGAAGLVIPNRTGFGDMSNAGTAETSLRWFTFTAGSACPADFDGDGFVTGLDFDAFVSAFEVGDPSSDFDHDGFVTGLDFDAYVMAFEAGC